MSEKTKTILAFLLLLYGNSFLMYGQKSTAIYLGGGFNSGLTDANQQKLSSAETNFHLGVFTPFLKKTSFNFGLNFSGEYAISSSEPSIINYQGFELNNATYSLTKSSFDSYKQNYFRAGVGPQMNFFFEKFTLSPIISFGYASYQQSQFGVDQNITYDNFGTTGEFSKTIFEQKEVSQSGFFWAPRLRFSYDISKNLSIWAEGNMNFFNYKVQQSTFTPYGTADGNNEWNWGQIVEGKTETIEKSTNRNNFGMNVGLAYTFGGKNTKTSKSKTGTKNSKVTATERESSSCGKSMLDNYAVSKTYRSKLKEFPTFSWKNKSKQVKSYTLNVYDEKKKLVYSKETSQNKLKTDKVLENVLTSASEKQDKRFSWNVTTQFQNCKPTTSDDGFIKMASRSQTIGITINSIECGKYTANGIEYKVNYTLDNYTGSAASWNVRTINYYDENGTLFLSTPVTYTISPGSQQVVNNVIVVLPFNATELQIATIGETGNIPNSGNVSTSHALPECYCDECENVEISINDANFTVSSQNPSVYAFTGKVAANIPIYGMEFQILSVDFSANPSSCSFGVRAVEESGMFIKPGSTINGVSNLENLNESVSGSMNTNNNISKIIRYGSLVPLNGNVPFSLNVGLPGPLPGLDASCCVLNYKVCIRVKVYTDVSHCNSCIYTVCYDFSNQ